MGSLLWIIFTLTCHLIHSVFYDARVLQASQNEQMFDFVRLLIARVYDKQQILTRCFEKTGKRTKENAALPGLPNTNQFK